MYYDCSAIANMKDCPWKIILGPRENGKSYSVKNKLVLDAMNDADMKFSYARRDEKDIVKIKVEDYFSDINVSKLTKKKYQFISVYRTEIFLANLTDGIEYRECKIGRAVSIQGAPSLKSNAFAGYRRILLEEFTTDKKYLEDEPSKFMDLVSTVTRGRENVEVWMIGNKLSRQSPYFYEWQLTNVQKQKGGTIDIYHYDDVNIAVEMTLPKDDKGIYFGQKRKSIIGGEWESKQYPKLWDKYDNFEMLYRVMLRHNGICYRVELLMHTEEEIPTVYVCPYSGILKKGKIITSEYSKELNVGLSFSEKNKAEALIIKLISLNKVVFSDNLTGTEFYNIIEEYI